MLAAPTTNRNLIIPAASSAGAPSWVIPVAVICGLLLLILIVILAVRYHHRNNGSYVVHEAGRIDEIVPEDFDDPVPPSGSRRPVFDADMDV